MKHTVVVPVFPGFQLLDVSGPVAVFEAASHFAGAGGGYELTLVSPAGGAVESSAAVAVDTRPFAVTGSADTLLVPGGAGTRDPRLEPAFVDFVARCAARARRVTSVCTGAFLLARAGLLDGRRATTHWRHAGALARAYPQVKVDADRIWVNDGRLWTSAGVCAGIDLALALVTDDFGREVARQCAREVVVFYQRPGGQSQFSSIEELADARGRFGPLLAWVRANLTQPLRVEHLAARMNMSPRNFSRRFRAEVGRSPAETVTQLRLEAARAMVETTTVPIGAIARQTGFGDAENMRRAFLKFLGVAPRALRTAAADIEPG